MSDAMPPVREKVEVLGVGVRTEDDANDGWGPKGKVWEEDGVLL